MFFRKALLVIAAAFFGGFAAAQDGTLRDIQLGMQGIMEAGKDPEALAQLMRDMQVRRVLCFFILLFATRRVGSTYHVNWRD